MTIWSGSSNNSADRLRTLIAIEQEQRRRRSRAARPEPTFRRDNLRAQAIADREWMLSGPSETGKTWATLWRLDTLLRMTPGAQAALVRKVSADLNGTVLVTYRRVIAMSGSGAQVSGGSHPEWYDYPNGARLWLGGMDRPTRILSGERDFVYVNQAEELAVADWETLTTRTTGRGAVTATPMLFGDCNPADPEHWILKRAAGGALTLLRSAHEDNPALHDGRDWTEQGRRTIATLDALTGARYARLRLGEWVYGDEDEAFLPSLALWDACMEALPAPDRRTPLILALDASVSGDTFAAVAVSRHPDRPEDVAQRWVQGWVPNGQALDYGAIEVELRQFMAAHNVVQIAYDPYQLHYMAERLSDTVWCEPFGQGADRLEADRQLLDVVVQRRLAHLGDARLRQHIGNAGRKMDADGRRLRLVKRSPDLKIDFAVALSMGVYRALALNLW